MALLVEYECEQTIQVYINLSTSIYQAYKEISNVSIQDINTSDR